MLLKFVHCLVNPKYANPKCLPVGGDDDHDDVVVLPESDSPLLSFYVSGVEKGNM